MDKEYPIIDTISLREIFLGAPAGAFDLTAISMIEQWPEFVAIQQYLDLARYITHESPATNSDEAKLFVVTVANDYIGFIAHTMGLEGDAVKQLCEDVGFLPIFDDTTGLFVQRSIAYAQETVDDLCTELTDTSGSFMSTETLGEVYQALTILDEFVSDLPSEFQNDNAAMRLRASIEIVKHLASQLKQPKTPCGKCDVCSCNKTQE